MQKINFEDYPSTNTPIDADNLNDLQDNMEEAVDLINTYSTDEIVIGTWLGKPLYRKVYSAGTLPNATTKNIPSGLIPSDVFIVKMEGIAKVETRNVYIPLPFVTTTELNCISLTFQTDGNIRIQTGVDRTEFNESYVVLEYTKTTDVIE
jgi:hypothetical protein